MAPTPANYLAYTAPINPPNATPALTIPQIWTCLQHKVRAAQDFVGGAIISTDVLSTSTTPTGLPVTEREILFRDGQRRVRETCVEYYPMKVEFIQPNGSRVMNIISEDAEGALWMTYTFEYLHPELTEEKVEEGLKERLGQQKQIAKVAVESTIKAMREMVGDGRVK